MKTVSLGPFLGINNRLPQTKLRVADKGDYLSSAVNVDVDDSGSLRRRDSELLVQAMTAPHSMFENYFVRDAVIYSFTATPSYSETLAKVLSSNATMTWVRHGSDVFYSNGVDSGRITSGTFYPIGLPTPAAPACAAIAGTMHAGIYQVALTFLNDVTGEEGGLSPTTQASLTLDGGLRVTLPSVPTGATHVNVYLTGTNGVLPYLLGKYSAASVDIAAMPTLLREAPVKLEDPLPAGSLFLSGKRLCSIVGSLVYVGSLYRYGYYDRVEGFLSFPHAVALGVDNQMGTYIVTEQTTHWFPGDVLNVQGAVFDPLPIGGVPGTAFRHPAKPVCGWFGKDGFVIADHAGQAVSATAEALDQTAPASGCAFVTDRNGYERVYSCGYCMNLSNNSVTQYSSYGFTSVSGEYGTKAGGIYKLTGGGDLAWSVGFGKFDAGSDRKKGAPYVYVGATSGVPLSLNVTTESGSTYSYNARSSSSSFEEIHRFDLGLGLRSNWLKFELYQSCNFLLSSLKIMKADSSRRI